MVGFKSDELLASELMLIGPDIPIILCSGFGAKISQEDVRALGVREFFEKPVERRKLIVAMRKILDESAADFSHLN